VQLNSTMRLISGTLRSTPLPWLEILYVEANYTRVRGLDDSETVKCSAIDYGVTCSKFKSVKLYVKLQRNISPTNPTQI